MFYEVYEKDGKRHLFLQFEDARTWARSNAITTIVQYCNGKRCDILYNWRLTKL